MKRYVWIFGDMAYLIWAHNDAEAYRVAIAYRVYISGQAVDEAEDWFAKSDSIHLVDGEVTVDPYDGELRALKEQKRG